MNEDLPDFMRGDLALPADDGPALLAGTAYVHPPFNRDDRRTYLGGSDLARLMGLAPTQWGTAVDLYFEKTEGQSEADPAREALFKRGKRLEPYVVQMLVEDYGVEVIARNRWYQDPEVPFFSCEVDFEWRAPNGEHCNGEIKTVHAFAPPDKWGEEGSGDVPIEYACQAAWNLGVTGRQRCMFGVLFGGDNLVRYWVERDDETIAAMRRTALEFWERHVLKRSPPPPRTLGDLGKLWPRESGRAVQATPEIAAAWTTLRMMRERAKAIAVAKEALEFEIGEYMKDADTLKLGDEKLCTLRMQERTTVDADRLALASPELYEKCAKTTTFRVLRDPNARKG